MRWLDSITDSMDLILSKFWEMVKDRESGHAAAHGVAKSQTQLSDQQPPPPQRSAVIAKHQVTRRRKARLSGASLTHSLLN